MRRVVTDIATVLGVAFVSLALGFLLNRLRANPVSLDYVSPSERLQAQLAQLVAAPPFDSFPVDTIDLARFRQVVEDKSALVVDARSTVYYQDGHVPGALNLSRDQFGRDYVKFRSTLERAKDRPIVVYCSGGACHDSKMVAQALTALGFNHVQIFAGGWDAWAAAGLPAIRG